MRLAVHEQGYASAVEALVSGNELAAQTATRLAGRLRTYGGMAGDDSTATEFASSYDEAATASIAALESTVGAFGVLGRMVEASLANHAHADARSTLPGWARAVVGPPTVADRTVGVRLAPPPSSLGADDGGPGGPAGMVLDLLADVFWPNADTDRVRAAGAAWTAAGEAVRLLEAHCGSALAALDGERSPEIPVAVAVVGDIRSQVLDLAGQLGALGSACYEYADHVDTKRSELRSLLEDLVEELAIGAILAGGLTFLSGGAAAGVAGSAGAARLASASAKARGILDSLRVLKGGSALASRDAALVAGDVRARAQWINGARVMFVEAGERAAAPRTIDETVTFLGRYEGPTRGHVLREHVGKSPSELYWRALNDPFTNRASSFHDETTAARLISETLARKQPEIDGWLAGTRRQQLLDDVFSDATGMLVDSTGHTSLVRGLRMVLVRDPSMPEGYWIKTAFPQPVR